MHPDSEALRPSLMHLIIYLKKRRKMKFFLCVLLMGWVYFTESVNHRNTNTLEKRSKTFNFSNDEIEQPLKRSRRYKRSNCGSDEVGYYFDARVKHCCMKCHEGEHVDQPCTSPWQYPTCTPCEEGTFLAFRNYALKCKRCTSCHQDIEVEVVKCSAKTNAKCVCKAGYYRDHDDCRACTVCHNRRTISNCTITNNTQCGDCLPGFYEDKSECQACPQSDKQCEATSSSCSPVCVPLTSTMSVAYILTGAFLLLLLPCGGLLIHKHKRKKKHQKGDHVFTVIGGGEVPGLTDLNQESRMYSPCTPAGHVPSVLQKNCTLYDIIDCVPVRRWKEFMRTLELPDKVIEIVEVEISNFRDQQYEMLRRWCQLQMASLDAVYQTLERMNLSRCAEELKAKIEHY
ncbi:tumor necrosis factor receptor superfamily member 25 [Phyllobates terribilis]|uniref:tumor necrosis factor receptor superfamily member 25 n=1 Tax=Phyllobates terribilis TaxID=111132 RepID=UPI003CCADA8B